MNCSVCKPSETLTFGDICVYVYVRLCICLPKVAERSPRRLG